MAISTQMTTSFKSELLSAGHCFNATVTPTASAASAATACSSVSSMTGVAVGMNVTGTGVAANTVIATITDGTHFSLSLPTTAIISAGTLTIAGDTFRMALIKPSPAGTYGTDTVNYSQLITSSDELTTTGGYTAAGFAMTNVQPTAQSTTAFVNFSPNPSWTSATFSTSGCMIYNSSVRNGGTSGTNVTGGGRACSVHDFGGNQVVSSGTFTVLMPTAASTTAIIRVQ